MGVPTGEKKKQSPLKSVISGGITGAVEATLTYPTEFVKTYMQLYKDMAKNGMIGTARSVYNSHGFGGFYRGCSVLIFFSIPKTGSRFGAYQYATNNLFVGDSRVNSLCCGLFAGTTEAILAVTPMETLKTKLIHDKIAETGKYRGLFHGIVTIAKQEGPGGLYQGLLPTIMKQGSNQAIRFLVYNEISGRMKTAGWNADFSTVLAGFLAGAASVYGNTPVDVVKTNMQGLKAKEFNGPLDCAMKIWKNEGFRGFYKGALPRLSRVGLDVPLTFLLFEHIKNAINKVWP